LIISFELRCAHITWGLNDCALIATEGNPLSYLLSDHPPHSKTMKHDSLLKRSSSRRLSTGGLNGPIAAAAASATATLSSVRQLLDDYATDPGRAVVWLASNPKAIKVIDQLQLKSMDLFNISQMALSSKTKAFRRAGTTGTLKAVFEDADESKQPARWHRKASKANLKEEDKKAVTATFSTVGRRAKIQVCALPV